MCMNLCVLRRFPCHSFIWLSIAAKELLLHLTSYPVKTSIWQDCFNCPAREQQKKSVFIKRVFIVWTARLGIRRLKSASAPDSIITPAGWPRCFKDPLNNFHTHFLLHLWDKVTFSYWASQVAIGKMNPLTAQLPNWQPGSSLDLPFAGISTETTQTPCLPEKKKKEFSKSLAGRFNWDTYVSCIL